MSLANLYRILVIALYIIGVQPLFAQSDPFIFNIQEALDADIGDTVLIAVNKIAGTTTPIDGFDMLVTYNPDQLTLLNAEPGGLIEGGVFEYFNARDGYLIDNGDSIYAARIVAIQEDGQDPVNYNPPITANGELIRMYFVVTDPYPCADCLIRFLWFDCGDNIISVPDFPPGDSVPGYILSQSVFNYNGVPVTDSMGFLPSLGGFPDTCFGYIGLDPVLRFADYYGGNIKTAGCGQFSDRGDLNLNGIPYELADLFIFADYFMIGLGAFTIDMEAQVAATEINNDGITLTLADYICMIRVIEGEIIPPPGKDIGDITGNIYISDTDSSLIVSTEFNQWIGGLLMNFSLDGVTSHSVDILDGADHMDYISNDADGSLKMLFYKVRSQGGSYLTAVIDSGYQLVAEIFYEDTDYLTIPFS